MSGWKININGPRDQKAVTKLIEEAFQYSPEHRFDIDFLPLFDHRFNSNSITASADGLLIGHVGFCLRHINVDNEKIPVIFLGGIAITAWGSRA